MSHEGEETDGKQFLKALQAAVLRFCKYVFRFSPMNPRKYPRYTQINEEIRKWTKSFYDAIVDDQFLPQFTARFPIRELLSKAKRVTGSPRDINKRDTIPLSPILSRWADGQININGMLLNPPALQQVYRWHELGINLANNKEIIQAWLDDSEERTPRLANSQIWEDFSDLDLWITRSLSSISI